MNNNKPTGSGPGSTNWSAARPDTPPQLTDSKDTSREESPAFDAARLNNHRTVRSANIERQLLGDNDDSQIDDGSAVPQKRVAQRQISRQNSNDSTASFVTAYGDPDQCVDDLEQQYAPESEFGAVPEPEPEYGAVPTPEPAVPLPPHDPSYKITSPLNPNEMVAVDGEEMSAVAWRDQLKDYRDKILAEQRDLMAQQHMVNQQDMFLKALSDPEFAREQGIKIILEVAGHAIQIMPPAAHKDFSAQQIDSYTRYVQASAINMFDQLPMADFLKQRLNENDKALKKVRKHLKKLGVAVDANVEKAMLKNTRILLELEGGSGKVRGEPRAELDIPDESLRNIPPSRLKADGYYMSSTPGDMRNSKFVREEDIPIPYNGSDEGDGGGDEGDSGYEQSISGSRLSRQSSFASTESDDLSEDEGRAGYPPPPPPPPPPWPTSSSPGDIRG